MKLKCSYQALELKDFDTRIAGTTGKGFNSQLGLTVELPGDAGRAGVGGKVDGDVAWLAEHEIVESHLTFGLRRNCKMVKKKKKTENQIGETVNSTQKREDVVNWNKKEKEKLTDDVQLGKSLARIVHRQPRAIGDATE